MISKNISPRFKDLDIYGHVNNAVFITYFEVVRVELFEQIRDELGNGTTFILAKQEIDYHQPIFLDSEVEARVSVVRIGQKSFDLQYNLLDPETNLSFATGKSTGVRYDYGQDKSILLSSAEKVMLERHLL